VILLIQFVLERRDSVLFSLGTLK